MKIKKILRVSSAAILSVSSLLVIGMPSAFAAGPYTCTWTGGGGNNNFSTAGNWSGCNSAAPQPGDGDNLIFDNTSLVAGATPHNDISNLSLATITFQGTNSSNYSFSITGNPISLSGGITNTSNGLLNSIQLAITLTANQTFTNSTATLFNIGAQGGSQTLTLGTHNLTLNDTVAGGVINVNSTLVGSGQLITSSGQPAGNYQLVVASPSFNGPVLVNSGILTIFDPASLGSGNVTVSDGATLKTTFTSANVTVSNPLTIGGSGSMQGGSANGVLNLSVDCPNGSSCVNDGTVTLSGPVTLTSNATVGTDATANFSGAISGGYTITLAPGYNGTIKLSNGNSSSASNASSSPSSTQAPKAPNTGLASFMTNPLYIVIATLVTSLTMVVLARRLTPNRGAAVK